MPIPTVITDLSTTASSNYPDGDSESPIVLDDVQRAHAAFIAQLRDDPTANIVAPVPVAKGGTGAATAGAAPTPTLSPPGWRWIPTRHPARRRRLTLLYIRLTPAR